jgi:hypothetical protein
MTGGVPARTDETLSLKQVKVCHHFSVFCFETFTSCSSVFVPFAATPLRKSDLLRVERKKSLYPNHSLSFDI